MCRIDESRQCAHTFAVRPVVLVALAIGVVALLAGTARIAGRAEPAPSAQALEARLLAPCCFGGTLDVHDSDVAHELRREIEARVAAGEPTEGIESDLVRRYGPQIRAMPSPGAWSATVLSVAVAIAAIAVVLGVRVRSWTRGAQPPVASKTPRDAYDDRLDAELEEIV